MIHRIWDIFERAETGPVCTEIDFDRKILPRKIRELTKTYGIVFDKEKIVTSDKTLANDVYKAAIDVLTDVGIFCTDTGRLIKFEEEELKELIHEAPNNVAIGAGMDRRIVSPRSIEDKKRPIIGTGPMSMPVTEDMYIPVHVSHAHPLADLIDHGTLKDVYGIDVKTGSTYEMLQEIYGALLARVALFKAGRPGMALSYPIAVDVAGDVGASLPEYGYRNTDCRLAWIKPELKTDYQNLRRAVHAHNYGVPLFSGACTMLGSVAGPEGTAIAAAANSIAGYILYGASVLTCMVVDVVSAGSSKRECIWPAQLGIQACDQNTKLLILGGPYACYAGPSTDMILYEAASTTLAEVTSGVEIAFSCNGRQASLTNYTTGLESRFTAEIALASTGLRREEANEIVKKLLDKYEPSIKSKKIPEGKEFRQCYDLRTIKPSKEWQEIYDKVKKELSDMGLKFPELQVRELGLLR